jgi:multicomponent Na+:H+ antiporter subunit E
VPGFLAYCVLLVKEIILANWQVMKLILRPDLEEQVQPQMVKFQVDIKSTIMRALLANSITLTPGTITVRAHNDHFIVHALTPEMGKDLDKSAFYTACKKLDAYVCKPDGTLEPDEEEEKTYVS